MERSGDVDALQKLGGKLMPFRLILRALLYACMGLALVAAAQQPQPVVDTRELLLSRKFAELEQIYGKQSRTAERYDQELLSVTYFHRMSLGMKPNEWALEDELTRAWLQYSPRSVPAAIARAYALSRHASYLDRTGQWAGVNKVLEEERKLLLAVQNAAAKDLTWHTLFVSLGRKEGWPVSRIKSAVEGGLRVDPTSLYFIHTAGRALVPDQRESPAGLAWLAREVAERTRATHGMSMYAIVFIWLKDMSLPVRVDPFGRGLIDWPTMNQALTDRSKGQPNDTYAYNEHAALACMAGDKNTTMEMLKRIGTEVVPKIWKDWGGEPLYERCKRFAQFGTVKS